VTTIALTITPSNGWRGAGPQAPLLPILSDGEAIAAFSNPYVFTGHPLPAVVSMLCISSTSVRSAFNLRPVTITLPYFIVTHSRRGMWRVSIADPIIMMPAVANTDGRANSESSTALTTGGPSCATSR
jgi:hypothetical protein